MGDQMNIKTKASRKKFGNSRIIPAVRDKRTDNYILKVWLSGKWLAEWGFVFDSVMTVEALNGSVILRLIAKEDCTAELVKHLRSQKMQLVQVFKVGQSHCIDIFGQVLVKAGFVAGEDCIATLEYGLITIRGCNSSVLLS